MNRNPERYSGLPRYDVFVRPKEHAWHKYREGQAELRGWLRTLASNVGVAEIYREMLPEICHVLMEDPEDPNLHFTLRDELLLYLDEAALKCLSSSQTDVADAVMV